MKIRIVALTFFFILQVEESGYFLQLLFAKTSKHKFKDWTPKLRGSLVKSEFYSRSLREFV